MRLLRPAGGLRVAFAAGLVFGLLPARAVAVEVELRDVAADRVERQRAYNRGHVPLPATPDLGRLDERLAAKGLARGNPIYIRVFKATSELELWMQKGASFVLLDTYPICHWTGTLGPKLKEGDKQSPEGFYSVSDRQMRLVGRWQKAFNLGFPNLVDQLNRRTGSFILVHGGCSSIGCFAMTEQVQDEIYALAAAAVKAGQERFQVHVFPFRMTEEAMAAFAEHTWASFWRDLKPAYDSFERTRIPPSIGVCEQRYHVTDGEPGSVGDQKAMATLRPLSAASSATQGSACVAEGIRIARQSAATSAVETGAIPSAAASPGGDGGARGQPAGAQAEKAVRTKVRRAGGGGQRDEDGSRQREEVLDVFGRPGRTGGQLTSGG